MENVIDPIDVEDLVKELEGNMVRRTTNGSNELYIVDARNSPKVMMEIGRLRELSFRNAGGGTGKSVDIDAEDLCENGYKQLIVWNPDQKEIIGGYRFIVVDPTKESHFSMSHYFEFSDEFYRDYYPHVMELGRSFIQPKYQGRSASAKSIYALDNLWDGLGAVVVLNPSLKYLVGKVTMYTNIDHELINLLYALLFKYFPVENDMVKAKSECEYTFDKSKYTHLLDGMDYSQAMKYISQRAKEYDTHYPPLFAAYANLSTTMRVFGTICNEDFGSVLETAIMITIDDLNEDKYQRYITNFQKELIDG